MRGPEDLAAFAAAGQGTPGGPAFPDGRDIGGRGGGGDEGGDGIMMPGLMHKLAAFGISLGPLGHCLPRSLKAKRGV